MHEWMKRHLAFLEENGERFARVFVTYPDQMQCGRGCALCCHGLFDISFADAFLLAGGGTAGFPQRRGSRLPPGHKSPKTSSSMRSPGLIPRFCCTVCPIASWIGLSNRLEARDALFSGATMSALSMSADRWHAASRARRWSIPGMDLSAIGAS